MTFCIAGTKVTGHYYGQNFSGTVESSRPHTMRHDVQIVFVDLSEPIKVYGEERNRVALDVDCVTGLPAKGFGPCRIQAAE